MGKDGMVIVRFPKTTYQESMATYVRGANNEVRPVTTYISRSTQEERSFHPDQLQVLGAGPLPLDAKELTKQLEKEVWCVFTQSPGAGNLRSVLKEGPLIITWMPRPSPPPAPAQPVPTAVVPH